MNACHALHNGQGGIDWAGLPLIAAWLGVADIDGLLHRMVLIKRLSRSGKRAEPETDDDQDD